MTTTSNITSAVRDSYGAMAATTVSTGNAGVRAVAEAFGYSAAELTSIPAEANLGLSCGNPTATANLHPGETVVDLGSGGGLDVFLAAQKVGPTGRAIGIDMTPAMIDRARKNAEKSPDGRPYTNVEFHLSTIDQIPLPDASVDVVISNCVINLAPDKSAVFREIARVLKPGGRIAISDIVLKQPLPPALTDSTAAWCGCVAGAVTANEFVAGLTAAGLQNVVTVDEKTDLNAYAKVDGQAACCSPAPVQIGSKKSKSLPIAGTGCCGHDRPASVHEELAALFQQIDINAYATSMKIYAVKPL